MDILSLKMFLANKAIQDHLLEVEESKDQMEKEMLEKIGKLEKELENANDLLSATKRKGMDWKMLINDLNEIQGLPTAFLLISTNSIFLVL